MYTTEVTTSPADGKGSIGGHKVACTCGMVWTTSLSASMAQVEANAHLVYHVKTGK